MTDTPLPPEARRAAAGLVALLLETDLTLEQRHYTRALSRLVEAAPAPPSAPSQLEGVAFDQAVLRELYRYLPKAGCAAIIEQFRASADQILTDIETASTRGDPDRLAQAAHALIGTAGAVGMAGLAAEARAVGTDLRAQRQQEAFVRAATLRPLYDLSIVTLDRMIAELGAP